MHKKGSHVDDSELVMKLMENLSALEVDSEKLMTWAVNNDLPSVGPVKKGAELSRSRRTISLVVFGGA